MWCIIRHPMREHRGTFLLYLLAFSFCAASVTASPEAMESGTPLRGVFGGITIELSNNSTTSESLPMAQLPVIAEVYTATWCENCVPAEEGLMSAIGESGKETTILAFHRAKAESEDPFGVLAADERWETRYGDASAAAVSIKRAPPTMVINGEWMHAGSGGLDGQALAPYYSESLDKPSRFSGEQGLSSLSWTPDGSGAGVVEWSLQAGDWLPENSESLLFVVEHSATFEEGSNGLGEYHDVVREMIELNGSSGQLDLTPMRAWEGDDLALVLIHQWELPAQDGGDEEGGGGLSSLPSVSPVALALSLVAGAIYLSKRMRR